MTPVWSRYAAPSLYDGLLSFRFKIKELLGRSDRYLDLLLNSRFNLRSDGVQQDDEMSETFEDLGISIASKLTYTQTEPAQAKGHVTLQNPTDGSIIYQTPEGGATLGEDGSFVDPTYQLTMEELITKYYGEDAYVQIISRLTSSEDYYGIVSQITEKLLQRKDVTLDEVRAILDKEMSISGTSKNRLFDIISTAASPSISQVGWGSVASKMIAESDNEASSSGSLTAREGKPFVFQEILDTVLNVIKIGLIAIIQALSGVLKSLVFAVGFLFTTILPALWNATDQNVVLNSGAANLYVYGSPGSVSIKLYEGTAVRYWIEEYSIRESTSAGTGLRDFLRDPYGNADTALRSSCYSIDMYEWVDKLRSTYNVTTALKASVDPLKFIKKIAQCFSESEALAATPPVWGRDVSYVSLSETGNSNPSYYPLFCDAQPVRDYTGNPGLTTKGPTSIVLDAENSVRASVDPTYAACSLMASLLADSFDLFYASWRATNVYNHVNHATFRMKRDNLNVFSRLSLGHWDLMALWMAFIPGVLRRYYELVHSGSSMSSLSWLNNIDDTYEWDDEALYAAVKEWWDISDVDMANEAYRAYSNFVADEADRLTYNWRTHTSDPQKSWNKNTAMFMVLANPSACRIEVDTDPYAEGTVDIQSDDSQYIATLLITNDYRENVLWVGWSCPWHPSWQGSNITVSRLNDVTELTRSQITVTGFDTPLTFDVDGVETTIKVSNKMPLYSVDSIPSDWTFKPPYLSTDLVKGLTVGASVIAGIVLVSSLAIRKVMKIRKTSKALTRQAKLQEAYNDWKQYGGEEALKRLTKASRKYNLLASLFNWPTYDPANNWFNEPAGMVEMSAAANASEAVGQALPMAANVLTTMGVVSDDNALIKVMSNYDSAAGTAKSLNDVIASISGQSEDIDGRFTALLQYLQTLNLPTSITSEINRLHHDIVSLIKGS